MAGMKPNRVLLVIDQQWLDPSSQVIDQDQAQTPFLELAGLLSAWNVPYDVLRLDQQRLDIHYFLDCDARPLYGCILWLADLAKAAPGHDDTAGLRRAVEEFGISLVLLGGSVQSPELAALAGLEADGHFVSLMKSWKTGMRVTADHPLVDGLETIPARDRWAMEYWRVQRVKATAAQVLAEHDNFAAITVRELTPDRHVLWIGGDWNMMFKHAAPEATLLLRRALTWCMGYLLTTCFDDTAVLTMDDPGCNGGLMFAWHSPGLTQEQIQELVIRPLKQQRAQLVIFVVPGFINRESRMIEPAWQQKVTDFFGDYHDTFSTRRGIGDGIAEGVLEVQCHGWTHLQPDLTSPPGPWHDQPLDREGSNPDWYFEFWDRARNRDIPANVQRFHLRRGREGLHRQFGQAPLAFRPGGFKFSRSPAHQTYRIAAGLDFAIGLGSVTFYRLQPDNVVELNHGAPLLLTCHDLDLFTRPDTIEQMCEQARTRRSCPQIRFIGIDELCAHLHTKVHATPTGLNIDMRGPHCRWAWENATRWRLHIAPWMDQVQVCGAGSERVTIDGMAGTIVTLPPGAGEHELAFVALNTVPANAGNPSPKTNSG